LKLKYDKLLESFAFNFNTRRYTQAASELSLHEENGRKMCLGGALKPLMVRRCRLKPVSASTE